MSKSRDELCKQSIDTFMADKYDIEYNINTLTENKSSSVHLYEIIMPRLVKLYDVDTEHTINGRRYPPGEVFNEQDLPTQSAFNADFNNYFEDYALYKEYYKGNELISEKTSYIEVTQVSIDTDKLLASVIVKYAKQYKPYPITQVQPINFEYKYNKIKQLYENLYSNVTILENDNYHYRRRLLNVKREFTNMQHEFVKKHSNIKHKFSALQQIIRTLYTRANQSEECPVCYENILAENLIVPECGHFICSMCSNKCSRCPLCRDVTL
jgi:hypothetical protein